MNTSFRKLGLATSVAVVLTSLVLTDVAEAQRRGGGGGGGAAASARAGGGGGGARQADARTNDVRSTSVNNVNVERNVNVNVEGCSGRCGGWDHPVAAAAVVAGTFAAIGSVVAAPPPNCVPVNYGGMVYQQCGGTWYAPQGSQYVVVNPPY
jgi:hypothetical protein